MMMVMVMVMTTMTDHSCCDHGVEIVKKEQAGLRHPGLRCAHFLGLSHWWGTCVQGHRSAPVCWFPRDPTPAMLSLINDL